MTAWVGSDAQGNNALATSVTIPGAPPSGSIALLVHPYNQGQAPADSTLTAGWTQLDSQDWSASFRARLYYKVLGAGEGGSVITCTQPVGGSQKLSAAIGVMSGVTAIHINGMRIETTSTAAHTAASATATKNVVQMAFIAERESVPSVAWSAPSGFTMGSQFHHVGSGATGVAVAYNLTPATGAIGGGTWTETGSIANDALVLFVVGLEIPLEATGDRTATATLTGAAAATRPATGDRLATATLSGAGAVTRVGAGNLTATATLTGDAAVTTTVPPVEPYEPRSPFLIEVWDGTVTPFVVKGRVGSYVSSEVIPRYNQVGSWKFTMTLSDGGVDLLTPVGRRITIDYRGTRILSGPVWGIRRARTGVEDQVEVYGYSDLVWLNRRLAFPNPLATFPADGVAFTQPAYRDTITDNVETMLKYWVTRNCVTRLPIPGLTVAPDLGRGPVRAYGPRFETVLEASTLIANPTGIGVTLDQVGGGLVFDVYEPSAVPVRFSRALGNLRDWEFINEGPNRTRDVIGLDGDLAARRYMLSRMSSSETGWGISEAFFDSSGDTDADRYAQGVDDLGENAPTYSFSVTPQETEGMRFGEAYGLGSIADTELLGQTLTDIVREVKITDSVENGVNVEPIIGNLDAAKRTDAVYLELRRLRAQINKRERET